MKAYDSVDLAINNGNGLLLSREQGSSNSRMNRTHVRPPASPPALARLVLERLL